MYNVAQVRNPGLILRRQLNIFNLFDTFVKIFNEISALRISFVLNLMYH